MVTIPKVSEAIKVDGVKAVILVPPPTKQELRDKLNWSIYMMNLRYADGEVGRKAKAS